MTGSTGSSAPTCSSGHGDCGPLERVRIALEDMRFGSVAVTVHEGRIVQIDITKKERFSPN